MNTSELPSDWESCHDSHLEWLSEHGSYGQRLIARRYLIDRAKQLAEKLGDNAVQTGRDALKRLGPRIARFAVAK